MSLGPWQYLITMGGYIGFLLGLVSIMRKHYRFAAWFWLASLLTIPLWLAGSVVGWFRWAKTLSVILPTIFLGLARVSNAEKRQGRFWELLRKNWVLWFLYAVLFLNIAEATIKDYTTGNYMNALTGLLLCATIPFPPRFWKFSKEGRGDLITYTTVGWNFLYTTWNLCFVYGESGAYFASSVCILLAAELYPLIKRRPELYIIARVYTLAAHLLIRACLPGIFPVLMDASGWMNPQVLKIWGLCNVALMIPYLFWHLWQLHSGKAELSFRRGRVEELDEAA